MGRRLTLMDSDFGSILSLQNVGTAEELFAVIARSGLCDPVLSAPVLYPCPVRTRTGPDRYRVQDRAKQSPLWQEIPSLRSQ